MNMRDYFTRKTVLILAVSIVAVELVSIGVIYRGSLAEYVWEQYHVFPDALLVVHPYHEFAEDIGDYYLSLQEYNAEAYDREKADFYYTKAHKWNPDDLWVVYKLALIDFVDGNFGNAHQKFTSLIESEHASDAMKHQSRYLRGLMYGYAEQFLNAEKDFVHLLNERGPDASWAYYVDLAWVYFQEGRYEDIRELAARGIEHFPNNAWLLSTYGTALLNTGEKEQAAEVLRKAHREAGQVTPERWARIYPGNDPAGAERGLEKMRSIIKKNYQLAGGGADLME